MNTPPAPTPAPTPTPSTPRQVLLDRHVFPGTSTKPLPPRRRGRGELETTPAFTETPLRPIAPLQPGHPDEPLAPYDLIRLKRVAETPMGAIDEATDKDQDPILTSKLRVEHTRRVLATIFNDPEQSLADLTPYRVRTAWRIVREMARHRGFIKPDEMLIEALEPAFIPRDPDDPDTDTELPEGSEAPDLTEPIDATTGLTHDRWLYPELFVKPAYDNKNPHMRLSMSVIEIMLEAERINPAFSPFQWELKSLEIDPGTVESRWFPHHYAGLALLPPNVPYQHVLRDGTIKPGYNPSSPLQDPSLHTYVRLLKVVSSWLYLDLGSKDDPDSGRYGLAGMLHAETVRAAFPSRVQIMTWETLLVDETLELIVQQGVPKATNILKDKYGLASLEVQQLIKMARAKASHMASGDSEEDRGLMILRLEDAARRARESLDIRAELAALKNLAVVQGLSRVEPQDAMSDFIDIVKTVSVGKRDMPALPPA